MQFVGANDPSYVVIHTMVGTIASADARFKSPAAQVSAHYGVGLGGDVVQWVSENDTAYHSGNWDMNLNSVGIEHEDDGDYNGPRSDSLYRASSSLVADICQRYGIPIDRSYVIKHNEVPGSSTGCPDALDIDRIVAMAAGTWRDPLAAIPAVAPTYPLADTPPAGTTIKVTIQGAVMPGARWYSSPNGQDIGAAPDGASVTIQGAFFDGTNWWDQISPGVAPAAAAWLLDSVVDTSDASHPANTNPTPAAFWNDSNKPVTAPPQTISQPQPVQPQAQADQQAAPPLQTLAQQQATADQQAPTGGQQPAIPSQPATPDQQAPAPDQQAPAPDQLAPAPDHLAPPAGAPTLPWDALRSVAAQVLGDATRWPEIHSALQTVLADVSKAFPHGAAIPPPVESLAGQSPAVLGQVVSAILPPVTPATDPAATSPGMVGSPTTPDPLLGGPPTPTPVTDIASQGQPTVSGGWGSSQGAIFALQVIYLTILAALAIVYFTDRSLIGLPEALGPVSVAVPWFGALGAVLISLVGVTEHRGDWDPSYRLWHWSRPLLGASFGTISVLIFQAGILAVGSTPAANQQNIPKNLLYFLVAFLVGYREETFREMIKRLADIVFSPGPTQKMPSISSMLPASGPAKGGTTVTILGGDLSGTQAVRFGAAPAKFNIDADSQVTAVSPAGTAGTSVSVTVLSKDGSASAGNFSYSPNAAGG